MGDIMGDIKATYSWVILYMIHSLAKGHLFMGDTIYDT